MLNTCIHKLSSLWFTATVGVTAEEDYRTIHNIPFMGESPIIGMNSYNFHILIPDFKNILCGLYDHIYDGVE